MNQAALDGVRILDLSQLIAGPSACSMLAELGAEVIKLESLSGDMSRGMGRGKKYGFSASYAAYNKGKRSIAVNLREPEGIAVARKLIESVDILVEAFRPGVMEKLGLGYEQVKAIKPDIVYVSFSGFGHDGPQANRPGVDLIVQGESGIMSITGDADREPMKIGFTAVDAAAGFALGQAALAGLVRRYTQGVGSYICLNLLDIALYMQAGPLTEYMMTGDEPQRTGNKAPLGSPAEVFQTQDGALIISAYFTHQWPELCQILGLPELLDDDRFATNTLRIENRPFLHPILQQKFLAATSGEWKQRLAQSRIMFGDVLSYAQVVAQPQVTHNGSIVAVSSKAGSLDTIGTPLRVAGNERKALCLSELGADRTEILAEAGLSQDEIERLKQAEIIL